MKDKIKDLIVQLGVMTDEKDMNRDIINDGKIHTIDEVLDFENVNIICSQQVTEKHKNIVHCLC